MIEEVKSDSVNKTDEEYVNLLDQNSGIIPKVGNSIKGAVISASKAEVKIDIDGVLIGVVRGPELYEEDDDYSNLKPGDEVEAMIIEKENENGELELSFRHAGQEKAWDDLKEAYENKKTVKIKVVDANKGGLMVKFRQIPGFLPVSQLAPENYPRVSGGDKGKIFEKLKSFSGREMEVKLITLNIKEDKLIFSEKDVWTEKQQNFIEKYKVGDAVDGQITAITDFGIFINFDDGMEGLIHISELAWQRIERPSDLYKIGDKVKAEIINMEKGKIFLSVKKLIKDPWEEAPKKYKEGQAIKGLILKVNSFGLFVKLDESIHGLAHISQLNLAPGQKIDELFKANTEIDFEVLSVEAKEHRLGLKLKTEEKKGEKEVSKEKKTVKKTKEKSEK